MFNLFKNGPKSKGSRNEDLPLDNQELPTSTQPNGLCPRCLKQSSFDYIGELPATYDGGVIIAQPWSNESNQPTYSDAVVSLKCRNCNQPVIVIEEEHSENGPVKDGNYGGRHTRKGLFWWPFTNNDRSNDVPEIIHKVLEEAKRARFAHCYRASAVMSRRTLECICDEKGEKEGNLYSRLKRLKERNILNETLHEWATEIRLIGNSGAHFDPLNDVTESDSKQIILFIEELIKYLYIMPAELHRRRHQK